jgi:hypothetical protein
LSKNKLTIERRGNKNFSDLSQEESELRKIYFISGEGNLYGFEAGWKKPSNLR